ncbi:MULTISPECIES: winged helix-turn-helix transcriptional regulator [Heyndrickxia]|jgi:DNA-binding HxlR family transcriptional regulator|uniref:winged helix-turn-helix transcriptional regulator n=1 Tax=Heyndrickxia TaxID=2837504 RepID=UPI0007EEC8EB|nr:helix-turn-helix domain-containing protein [Heyndrickxia oleronia]MCI1590607.1 helix-turn-helix transcriptional regulator [Heyndrickxia oleronia]MCI1614263.1 helix-turn-helix transcriptional regulator [Heyndrickxia oleronia]MCI1745081.1 helix-turn-helix transcriptional regulator [Heyndrickxia oleronia]MCI1762165.1 helix-turn-helix transcriptional regulator [Heyndrickxia oleronia]MCM3456187.1 helix-turn-helix transcriptional regulator [Heyndrickxia oleronia]
MNESNNDNCLQNKLKSQHICDNFHGAIEFIGRRWMGLIIYNLLNGPKRYYELLEEIPGISDRLLTERLKELENEGLVEKRILTSSPRKVEYLLTEAGKSLEAVLFSLLKWVKDNKKLKS